MSKSNTTNPLKEDNWPDEIRLKMIERSKFYQEPFIYEYGYYDGYQEAKKASKESNTDCHLRWVRASKELPDRSGWFYVKCHNIYLEVATYDAKRGFQYPPPLKDKPLPWELKDIYWLDESASKESNTDCEANHLDINELLLEFNRRGFNTENWDGDEGAEKAIVEGVCNYLEERQEKLFDQITEQHMEINRLKSNTDCSVEQGAFISRQNEIIGRLTTEVSFLKDSQSKRDEWLREAKQAAGYDNYTSFDVVWKDALAALKSSQLKPVDCSVDGSEAKKKQTYAEAFRQLREIGSAWDNIICVCRGLMRESGCHLNCKEFHDESLPNERQTPPNTEQLKQNEPGG